MKIDNNIVPNVYFKERDRCGREAVKPYQGKFKYKNTSYNCGMHETIRGTQIAVDKKRLELGLKPLVLISAKKE